MRLLVSSILTVFAMLSAAAAQDLDASRTARDADRSEILGDLVRSAGRGDADAQYELGIRYANGEGVAADYAQAARWFEQAAGNGSADARGHLVFMAQMGLATVAAASLVPPPAAAVPSPASTSTQSAPTAPAGGVFRIQVATVSNETDGPREWRRLQRRYPDALASLAVAVVAFEGPDGAHRFRVEGGPLDEEGARTVCTKLRADGAGCRIIRPQ